eukprot:CAMPEP_0174838040 /NCGR_PEP_ID=MMETSP1114-20130205/7150_1 /TAXON_ID=312471 /ORGANISM="Neobodo designis, Strain CCAP 1951/1" /LENGTH=332 /DNA_ID=CAMNT_0016072129 /DNA_START=39 /DNA_END=1034 /DNA_ORIENTATION=+
MAHDFESDSSYASFASRDHSFDRHYFEEEALQEIQEAVIAAEEIERLHLTIAAAEGIAAVSIQRAFRGLRARRLLRRCLAARRLRAVCRGYRERAWLGKLLCERNELRERQALKADDRSGRTSPVQPRAAESVARQSGASHGVLLLQRWLRRVLPALRSRVRQKRLRLVVRACCSIQRTWRGFVARRRFSSDLKRLRWDRQLHALRDELDGVSTAPEALKLRAALGVGVDGRGAKPTEELLAGGAIDPEADAAYFNNIGSAPAHWRDRRAPSIEDRAVFVTASMGVVCRSLDIAERQTELRERRLTGRRIREALHHSRTTAPKNRAVLAKHP